jgi:hypothetical protein
MKRLDVAQKKHAAIPLHGVSLRAARHIVAAEILQLEPANAWWAFLLRQPVLIPPMIEQRL